MNELITIEKVRGYVGENGMIFLNLEDVARGLGFTQIKNQIEYVRTDRVTNYLNEFGFPTCGEKFSDIYIPENIFYLLAMKGKNEIAKNFQLKVANKILPAIRKTGMYATDSGTTGENTGKIVLSGENTTGMGASDSASITNKNEISGTVKNVIGMYSKGSGTNVTNMKNIKFSKVRRLIDIISVSVSLLITLLFSYPLVIREGTVVSLLLFSTVIGYFHEKFVKIEAIRNLKIFI